MVNSAIDRVRNDANLLNQLGKIGLVTNQACTTQDFVPTVDVVVNALEKARGSTLTAVFGPQHGYGQTEQDNMIETPDSTLVMPSGKTVPLYSLYSKTRIPTPEQLKNVDTLVVDLQDVGCRVYTYMLTLAGCMRAAEKAKKKVVVLDRPNPLGLSQLKSPGDFTQGNNLDMRWESFVGWYSIPMRHGLTLGELGKLFHATDKMSIPYEVITVDGLKRSTPLSVLSQRRWTLPSPNLPTWETAFCFPSFVALETTMISEGRGTTLPFQTVGAPNLPAQRMLSAFSDWNRTAPEHLRFSGLKFRTHEFRPTFNKHQGALCKGFQIHVENPEHCNTFALGVLFLAAAASDFKEFQWKGPGYEYNLVDPPVHLVLGNSRWRDFFDSLRGRPWSAVLQAELVDMLKWSENDAKAFEEMSSAYHLYTEN
ncbi:MAG: DUF1343 domain-containing protein [Betaproteobacteria bacterium]|nr:DUF1343 domain-containing protein [Betaproteobacteria bacterium]